MKPPIPANEAERLAALHEYHILDTLPEQAYDDITLLASQLCGTPIALITLIDARRQWFKSRRGLEEQETSRDVSFCAHAILETDLVEVPDTTKDRRFADNPYVTSGRMFRFYAAAPLVTPDGQTLGTLCVMDLVPRRLSAEQQVGLRALARQTMAQLELRRHVGRLESISSQLTREHRESAERAQRADGYHAVLMELARLDKSDLPSTLRMITQRDAEALAVSRVSVWLFEREGSALLCSDLYDARQQEHTSGQRLDSVSYPCYFAAMGERRVIVANDARTDPCTNEFTDHYLDPNGITSMLDVPIWRDGRIVGIVCHEHTDSPRSWSAEEQDFAVSVADMVTLALEAHERRQIEEALRASEASYRAIFDLSNDAIYVHDPDTGAVVDVNRKACDEHGYTREEIMQLELGALSAGEGEYTRQQLLEHFRRAAAGEPQVFEWLEATRSGRLLWKEVSLRHVMINGQSRLLAAARDITEHKRSAEALKRARDELERRVVERTAELARVNAVLHAEIRERERAERELQRRTADIEERETQFRMLIENSSDIASVLDEHGIVQYQSPSVQRVLGYKPDELTGISAFAFIHPDDVAQASAAFGELLSSPRESRAVEFRFLHKDGSWRVLEGIGRVLPKDSPLPGVVVNSRDVTERRRAQHAVQLAMQEAEDARESAERANRAKSEFLSRMSHELRTPMNSILGFAQLLGRKDLPGDQRKAVDHILKAGHHLLNLINEVLDIARIETDRQPFSLEPVRVSAVLQETLNLIRPLAAQRECRIDDDVSSAGDAHVRADRQRLTQVLLNLLSNAVKYNRPGGSVNITCDQMEDDRGGATVRIHVHDTGPGIPPEKLDYLFTPFERLGAQHTDVEGTGLGLALSRRLVEAMGGTIGITSTSEQGSTFTLCLPTADNPLSRFQGPVGVERRREPRPNTRSAKILYIEDNLANLTLIETILATRPHVKVIPALQGQLGLDLAWEHGPDLILLDVHLPDMAGDEVLGRLRSDARTARTPVIVITADAMPGRDARLLDRGAQAFMTKPIDVERFLTTVDRFLAERVA
jgi:PAS domain S-box-containing protein